MIRPPKPRTGRALAAALGFLLLAAGCDWPGKPDPANRPVPSDKVTAFEPLYRQHCSACHGADGKRGPAPPLDDPLFLQLVPDPELLRVVRDGRRGTPMPAFARENGGPLTEAQVRALAEGIKPRWARRVSAGGAPPYLATAGGASPSRESVERGEKVFARACAVCHGERGRGNEEGGRVADRINDPAFLALISDQALRRLVITGRPDFGMPDYAGRRPGEPEFKPLTAAEVSDLVALLASWAPGRPGRGLENDTGGGE